MPAIATTYESTNASAESTTYCTAIHTAIVAANEVPYFFVSH